MKKSILLLGALMVVFSCKKEATKEDIVNYASSITETELKDHLYVYASDEFEGRNTGDPGQKKAVEYIKKEYETLGIGPLIEGNYFQDVPLDAVSAAEISIKVNGKTYNNYEDFVSISTGDSGTLNADNVVYAGFGIDDEKYSDYKDIDVNGKVVIVKAGEPTDKDGNNVISGDKKASKWGGRSGLSSKRDAAKDKGAKAIFIMDNSLFDRYAAFFKRRAESGSKSLSLPSKGDEANMYRFLISEKLAKALVPNIGKKSTKEGVVNSKVEINYTSKTEKLPSENVAAIIKGSEKPDEYIILSSHLDHVGVNDKGEVFNGADDDGSGTVSMLEIAEAFKTAADKGHGPKRSIIFLHVTGEEKGLLGSRYYTDYEPLVPLANTVANLNIDMIGRIDPKRKGDRNYIYLIGADKLSTDLHNISEAVNKEFMNIELDYTYNDENDPNRFYYRSDHYNFAKNNIPIIFYFNGTHDDYHRVTDTPDKINYDLLENRSRLVFHTAWELANREARIVVDKAEEKTE